MKVTMIYEKCVLFLKKKFVCPSSVKKFKTLTIHTMLIFLIDSHGFRCAPYQKNNRDSNKIIVFFYYHCVTIFFGCLPGFLFAINYYSKYFQILFIFIYKINGHLCANLIQKKKIQQEKSKMK